jgi:hypothetical protein
MIQKFYKYVVEWSNVPNMAHENQALLKTIFYRHDYNSRPTISIIKYEKRANTTGTLATHQNTNCGDRVLLGDTEN